MVIIWLARKMISEDVRKLVGELLEHPQDYNQIEGSTIFKGPNYPSYEIAIGYYCYARRGENHVNFNWIERQLVKRAKRVWADSLMIIKTDMFNNRDY